jgi:osomolarity two-component system, sensor histidine kinase SLN1
MPNLDGLQSTRLIRQMGYVNPIVALTAFAEESNVQQCYDSGMDHFLRSALDQSILLNQASNCLTANPFDDQPLNRF